MPSDPFDDDVVDGGTRPLDAGFCLKAEGVDEGVGGFQAGGGVVQSAMTEARALGRGDCAGKTPEVATTAPPNSSKDPGVCCWR